MNESAFPFRRCSRLLLLSEDAILCEFFRETVARDLALTLEILPPRAASGRIAGSDESIAFVLDQRAFDLMAHELGRDRAGSPLLLVTGQLDRTTVRRLLAAGGTAIIPTSFERAHFLNAVSLALSGDYFFPSSLWMPYLEETLAVGAADGTLPAASGLTRREHDVLAELARGKTNKMIAFSLGISEPTVKMHLAHLGKKLGVGNRTQLLTRAIRQGLIRDLAVGAGEEVPGA